MTLLAVGAVLCVYHPMDGAVSNSQHFNFMNELLPCPFCGAEGKPAEAWDEDLFPSGKAVMCSGGCWIDGVLVDQDAWQKRTSGCELINPL